MLRAGRGGGGVQEFLSPFSIFPESCNVVMLTL